MTEKLSVVNNLTSGGPGYSTEVPAKFIMDNLFERQNIGLAAAGATVLLVSALAVIVPLKYAIHLREKLAKGASQA